MQMGKSFRCFASAAFGMEGLVSEELKRMGLADVLAENGGVCFSASDEDVFRSNLMMHFSDRIYVILASGQCRCFEDLFQLVRSVDWPGLFHRDESIDISCKCTRSTLMSQRDCQSVAKKAIIETLKDKTGQRVFTETGTSLSIQITIRNDLARILLNTSGDALSRRGYRTWNGEAPLRETLAAALVKLSGWKPGQPLHDPCCGTGTIVAEAALMAAGIAPGQNRQFAMEKYKCFEKLDYGFLRSRSSAGIDMTAAHGISGSDIDSSALELAKRHIIQAGFDPETIPLQQIPLQDLSISAGNGVFICNPPYGERLSDQKECRKLYHDLHMLKQRHPTWRLCAISSDPAFERSYGKKAGKKRRLYNGRLECVFYIYD